MGSHKIVSCQYWLWHYWFEALNGVVHHEKLTALPKILETPYVGEDKNKRPLRL